MEVQLCRMSLLLVQCTYKSTNYQLESMQKSTRLCCILGLVVMDLFRLKLLLCFVPIWPLYFLIYFCFHFPMESFHFLNRHLAFLQSWIFACILSFAVKGIRTRGASHQKVQVGCDRCQRVRIKYSWFFGFEAAKVSLSFLSLASWDSKP